MILDCPCHQAQRRNKAGHTLVELAAVLAIMTIAAAVASSGIAALRDGVSLLSTRQQVAAALEYARREAYRRATTGRVAAGADGHSLNVAVDGLPLRHFTLDRGRIIDQPARGHVSFFASGLAENSTFTIANLGGVEARVIVNQRGEIRWR